MGAGVAPVRMAPRIGILNQMVPITIPLIPIVAIGCRCNLVLRLIGVAANGRHVASVNFAAALRGCNLNFPLTHNDNRVAIWTDFNPEYSVMMRGMNGYVRSVDLRLSLAVLGNGVIHNSLAKLNLDVLVSEIGNVCS